MIETLISLAKTIILPAVIAVGVMFGIQGALPPTGATIPKVVAVFETSLQSSITSSATSMTLVNGTDSSGDALSGYTCFVIDEGTASEEFVCGTATGTSIASMIRGIDPVDGDEEVTSLKKSHRRGASVKISNHPSLTVISRILNGDETFPNIISYNSQPSFTGDEEIITKKYADDLSFAGTPDGTETTKGVFELASITELAAGTATGGTSANIVAHAEDFGSTSSAKQMVPVTEADGDISIGFMQLDATWTFTSVVDINTATNFRLGGTAFTGTMADLNEAEVFFGATNITGAEAEDLTDEGESTAHFHPFTASTDFVSPSWFTTTIPFETSTFTEGSSDIITHRISGGDLGGPSQSDLTAYIDGFGMDAAIDWDDLAKKMRVVFQAAPDNAGIGTTPSGSGDNWGFVGFSAATPDGLNYGDITDVVVRAGFAFYNGRIYSVTTDGSTVETTDIAAYTSAQIDTFGIELDPVGSQILFYRNGSLAGTHSTNLPFASTANIFFGTAMHDADSLAGTSYLSNINFSIEL